MKPGDVALVRFPFSELTAEKKRPALVLAETARSPSYRLAPVAMSTSQLEALKLNGDALLADWKAAGLLHPSLLRLAKVATIDAELIDKVIGRLLAIDRKEARAAFRRALATWLE